MNRTMVKRGIGAAVLAIIAALLLGYLLKGKDQERQEVVDMTLPGASEVKQSLNIPSLKGGDAQASLQSADTTSASEAVVVASAAGAADKVNQATKDINTKEIAVNTFKNKGDDLDFTVRPPKGERREIVDNIGKSKQQIVSSSASSSASSDSTSSSNGDIAASASANSSNSSSSQNKSGSITRSSSSQGTVVASSDDQPQRRAYRHRLVDEQKRSPSYTASEKSSRESRQERRERRAQRREERKKAAELKKAANKEKAEAKQTGHFAIQLLATSSSSRANNLKKVMNTEGYPTKVSKTSKNGKVLFRVRIGDYLTRQAAVSAQRKMQRRYRRNQHINSSLIVNQ
ncbi:MAG: SPOR domain-containing protein [Cocleimonas sp.]|nr:SPOR domain-containing protein [Cocleimonas sp.]